MIMLDAIKKKLDLQLQQLNELTSNDLKTIKTGRAKPSLIEDVKIEVYEARMSLKELASISAPDPHTLVISPWDKNIVKEIEKGIAIAGINLHPIVDNDLIRIQIPPLNEETRKDLVKLVYQKIESARILLRQMRNEIKKEIESLDGQAGISEDNIRDWVEELQKEIEDRQVKLEEMAKSKEKELMTI